MAGGCGKNCQCCKVEEEMRQTLTPPCSQTADTHLLEKVFAPENVTVVTKCLMQDRGRQRPVIKRCRARGHPP